MPNARRVREREAPASPRLSLQFFGPFKANIGDAPLASCRSKKTQRLLAALALRHGREVERSWLAGMLWPESTEQHAYASLRITLCDLRRALGTESERLRSPTQRTLTLDLAGTKVDLLSFNEAVEKGDVASLESAVGLYSGPLLEGWNEVWAIESRTAFEIAMLNALGKLASAATELGRPQEAIPWLRRQLSIDPFCESALRELIECLAASGQIAAAVEAHRDFRLYLRRELCTDPAEETTRLIERVLRQSNRRNDPPKRERRLVGVDFAPLPRPVTRLIGREEELTKVAAKVRSFRLVTLTGAGGAGKTRLAVHVAEELSTWFEDGACLIELASVRDEQFVPKAVATALGLRDHPGKSQTETIAAALRESDLLIVLDNCEHVVEACAKLANSLLLSCPGLRILATSRDPLKITGEALFRVPPMTFPPMEGDERAILIEERKWDSPILEALRYEAVQLFVERATQACSEFQLNLQSAHAVSRICQRLDGMPLAIEMAAARVDSLAPEEIAKRIDSRFELLTSGSRTALPRQQTLRATQDWSYDLLHDSEKKILQRVSVFAGGWFLESAVDICSDSGLEPEEVQRGLGILSDCNLVASNNVGTSRRYWLLETVREYAHGKLQESGMIDEFRDSHLRHFKCLAELAETQLFGGEQSNWLRRLELEHDNFRQALDWATRPSISENPHDLERGMASLQIAAALHRFWHRRGHIGEGRAWYALALKTEAGRDKTLARARGLQSDGNFAYRQGFCDEAELILLEALALSRELGYQPGVGRCTYGLAIMEGWKLQFDKSADLLRKSLVVGEAIGDERLTSDCHGALGVYEHHRENFEASEGHFRICLSMCQRRGDIASEGHCLNNLGQLYAAQGQFEKALEYMKEALSLSWESGDGIALEEELEFVGAILASMGRFESAATSIATSERLRELHGTPLHPAALADHRKAVETIRTALQPEIFSKAWKQGQEMATLQVLELVESEANEVGDPVNKARRAEVRPGVR